MSRGGDGGEGGEERGGGQVELVGGRILNIIT